MSPTSPIPIIIGMAVALITVGFFNKWQFSSVGMNRFASIDGLRGLLAFSVFLHHSCYWYFYLQTGEWQDPPSNLYHHLGLSSVAIFFMITAFLFYSKILDGRHTSVDWVRLFVSRFLRLTPLYLLALLIIFLIVAVLSRGILLVSVSSLMVQIAEWASFTILIDPDINALKQTYLIVAGVTWSLRYEWLFYVSLPIWALTCRTKVATKWIVLSTFLVIFFILFCGINEMRFCAFFGGILAAVCARSEFIKNLLSKGWVSLVVVVAAILLIFLYHETWEVPELLLLSIIFIPIACGNTLWNILTGRLLVRLGEASYGIYLLHGIFLYVVFKILIGVSVAATLTPLEFWGVVILIVPFLVSLTLYTYEHLELPFIRSASATTTWIRGVITNTSRKLPNSQ